MSVRSVRFSPPEGQPKSVFDLSRVQWPPTASEFLLQIYKQAVRAQKPYYTYALSLAFTSSGTAQDTQKMEFFSNAAGLIGLPIGKTDFAVKQVRATAFQYLAENPRAISVDLNEKYLVFAGDLEDDMILRLFKILVYSRRYDQCKALGIVFESNVFKKTKPSHIFNHTVSFDMKNWYQYDVKSKLREYRASRSEIGKYKKLAIAKIFGEPEEGLEDEFFNAQSIYVRNVAVDLIAKRSCSTPTKATLEDLYACLKEANLSDEERIWVYYQILYAKIVLNVPLFAEYVNYEFDLVWPDDLTEFMRDYREKDSTTAYKIAWNHALQVLNCPLDKIEVESTVLFPTKVERTFLMKFRSYLSGDRVGIRLNEFTANILLHELREDCDALVAFHYALLYLLARDYSQKRHQAEQEKARVRQEQESAKRVAEHEEGLSEVAECVDSFYLRF